ncbi:adenylosuccinate lyase [Lutimonas zeaxanthinifaciens]|uniref:adenylosuccinate lyase n=1 Tax=Lutimonas zeaxanthinifaciens TaxID=3060215 RepID=UPI00265C91C3|nr:adenylosuccinate lyase [Lutimonas sp. YSD2104]WKK64807.1 adenylosuccinate lyase [Lutimonas sp. YSD2104]
MGNKQLIGILEGIINAKRMYRDKAALAISQNPALFPELIDKLYDVSDPLHIKAAWVLELVSLENISILDNYISKFIQGFPKLSNESALRPVSKTCFYWCSYYFSERYKGPELNQKNKETIISCNFDWLIEDHKVATQVFAMDTLNLWSKDENWIGPELKSILETRTELSSSGYKAHARKLLKNL